MEKKNVIQVVCMIKGNRRDVYVVDTNEFNTAEKRIESLIEGERDMSPYESGFVVSGEYRDEILRAYARYSTAPGHWEHPGIYITHSKEHLPFSKNTYQPYYILAQWNGDSSKLS